MKRTKNLKTSSQLTAFLIAACGMNCGLCRGYQRENNRCSGCRSLDPGKPAYCFKCIIRNCEEFKGGQKKYCYECKEYPCRRLKQLDQRYRTKYRMSMIENLGFIQTRGIRAFVNNEKNRWACPDCGGVLCVHLKQCMACSKEHKFGRIIRHTARASKIVRRKCKQDSAF
jgi:hypothetical protein